MSPLFAPLQSYGSAVFTPAGVVSISTLNAGWWVQSGLQLLTVWHGNNFAHRGRSLRPYLSKLQIFQNYTAAYF
jgi:hypothetical protein